MFDIDIRELEEFHATLEKLEEQFPRESKKMLQKVGNKAKAIVYKNARRLVKKHTGNYFKSIKRGKVWDDTEGITVRVYSNAPHKFLIENGHRIVDKNGQEHGFQPGYKVFDRSSREIEENFMKIVVTELNKIFDKL